MLETCRKALHRSKKSRLKLLDKHREMGTMVQEPAPFLLRIKVVAMLIVIFALEYADHVNKRD
jgi:hypothetical protein